MLTTKSLEGTPSQTVQALVARHARTAPDRIAVAAEDGQLSYAELHRRALMLAERLRELGVGPDRLVAVATERSAARVVALLGVLEAGGAYLPLDPESPRERLLAMLDDARPVALVADGSVAAELPQAAPPRVDLERFDWRRSSGAASTPSGAGGGPEHLVYVCFTSGSTGRPKGVAVPHRAVVRLVAGADFADLGPETVFAHLAPLAFDASTLEIWGPLANGGRLAVHPPGRIGIDELADWLAREGVGSLWLTAGLFNQVVERRPDALGRLEHLLTGGEAASPEHVERALAAMPHGRLTNGYGPTENTTFTTCHRLDGAAAVPRPVPIGRAIAGTRAVVLGSGGEPLADGAIGELATGGRGLARGYLGRPAPTAERFVPDPTAAEPGGRVYRTGDRALRRPDGVFEYLGRLDDQVKIRGHRIEPGEIEVHLRALPGVAEAAVVAREDRLGEGGAGERRLVAYVTPAGDRALSAGELRRELAARLPPPMIPAAFVTLAELPLTPQGKVDRRALLAAELAPPRGRPELASPPVAPRDDTEAAVAEVWEDLLGIEGLGVEDDLFELGGHSLVATRIVARLRDRFGVEVPIARAFAEPRIAAMAAAVRDAAGAALAAGPVPGPRRAEAPLAAGQEQVWFVQALDPDSLAYNFQALLRFRGALDEPALARALAGVVRRHEIFRTTFAAPGGTPVQRIHARTTLRLPRVDLTALPAERRPAEARRGVERAHRRPYDLTRLPLIYWVVFRLSPDDRWVLHAEHHLIHDGWSFNVFLEELAALYRCELGTGKAPPQPPLQYADFAVWQRRWLESDEARRQLAWWTERLSPPPPPLELPRDRPRPAAQSFRGDLLREELSPRRTAALRRLAHGAGATLYMTLLAAFYVLLHRHAGADDLAIGCGIANRRFRAVERLLGMVINTVVLRADLSGAPTFRELLERVRRRAREAYAHQDLPLERVVEALCPERDAGRNPLFDVLFSVHDAPLGDLGLDGVDLETTLPLPNGSAKFDLNVIGVLPREQRVGSGRPGHGRDAAGDGMTLAWEYNRDLFDRTTARRLLGHYLALLDAVAADPERPIAELPMLSAAERHQCLVEWNDTAIGGAGGATVADLFTAAAEAAPDAIAIEAAAFALSYGELARRAERLAACLCARGAGPERRVVMLLERSPELVIALVAAVRAGAPYVPIDPSYPRERIELLLADCGPAAVVTSPRLAGRLPAGGPAPPDDPVPLDGPRLVRIDAGGRPLARPEGAGRPTAAAAGPAAGPDHAVYVLYTSGSTGRPKGVEVPHRAVVRLVRGARYARLDRGEVVLLYCSPSFDVSTFELWGALANGARLVVPPPGARGLRELAGDLERHRVSTAWLTAGLFHQMADGPLSVATAGATALRQLLAGGDVLSPAHVRRALEALPGCRLIDGYGPTENTTFTTCHAMDAPGEVRAPVPIGRPIGGTTVYVVGADSRAVPPGSEGELWTGGEGVARGYLGRPALTAARFVPDPFSGLPGARLYRTGDLGRWRADGRLEFRGRRDGQVKLRGFRVELAEVEAVLAGHPAIERCAAAIHDRGDGSRREEERRLVAWVTPSRAARMSGEPPDPAALRAWLAGRLPEFMVPAHVEVVDELPLNASGKVDRRRLAAAALSASAAGAGEPEAPRTEVEEIVAAIWCELLGRSRVGVRQSFFTLGGHSLQATRLMYRIEEVLGVALPLRVLYQAPTVEVLAARVEAALIAELTSPDEAELERRAG